MSVSWLHSVLADLYEQWNNYSLGCVYGAGRRQEGQNARDRSQIVDGRSFSKILFCLAGLHAVYNFSILSEKGFQGLFSLFSSSS